MKYITRKSDVSYLTGIDFEQDGEIELLVGPRRIYVLCDPRNSHRIRSMGRSWEVVDSRKSHRELLGQARLLEMDPTHVTVEKFEKLRRINPHVAWKKNFIRRLRQVKTEEEIRKIVASQRVNERILESILSQIGLGMTELDLQRIILTEQIAQANQGASFTPIVAFQENGANPHHICTDRPLQRGDQILIDMGVVVEGYCSDMTRIIFTDAGTKLQKEILDILIDATNKTIEYGRVGMKGSDLHKYASKQLGTYKKYFTHSLGHGIGRDIHEYPSISLHSQTKIRDGMVFTIEPGIYIPGTLGSRYEQIVMIQNGLLTPITCASKKYTINL